MMTAIKIYPQVDIIYFKGIQKIYSDLSFQPEITNIDKNEKRLFTMFEKKMYALYMKGLQQALDCS